MRIPAAFILAAVVLLSAPAPAQEKAEADTRPARARVLFIGNSLTYANNLPGMIEAIAAQAGLEGRVTVRAVARPDFGLEDHWNGGEALRALAEERWTHVVLQQGPSSLPESQRVLREFAKKFAFEIRKSGGRPVLYGVWPPIGRHAFFDAVTVSYARAAEDVAGTLVAVGEGWRAAWRRNPSLRLYGPDGFHPSPMGTYLGALMFFHEFTGRSPVGLPPPSASRAKVLQGFVITAAELALLQEAALESRGSGVPGAHGFGFKGSRLRVAGVSVTP